MPLTIIPTSPSASHLTPTTPVNFTVEGSGSIQDIVLTVIYAGSNTRELAYDSTHGFNGYYLGPTNKVVSTNDPATGKTISTFTLLRDGGWPVDITVEIAQSGSAGGVSVNHVFASNFPGADLGAQIMAADAFLGTGTGIIEVPDGNYTVSTPVSLSDNRTLILGLGTISSTVAGSPTWMWRSNSSIVGKGWGTLLKESTDTSTSYALSVMANATNVADIQADGAYNVLLEDFCVEGANPSFVGASATATVSIGNSKNTFINRVFWDGTKSLGLVIGASSVGGGFHAENTWVTGCKFFNVGSQNCSVVNGKNTFINGNKFLAAGVPSDPTNATYIDFEPNAVNDLIEGFEICNNTFDTRGALVTGNGVVIQDSSGRVGIGKGLIANNNFIGDDGGSNFSSAIYLVGQHDVTVTGNQIRRAVGSGITLDSCHGCHVGNNSVNECGGGGIASMTIIDSTSNHIVGNSFFMNGTSGSQDARVLETGTSDYNTIECNKFDRYLGTGAIQGYVQFVGANTVVRQNDYAGRSADQTASFGPVSLVSLSRAVTLSDDTVFVDTSSGAVTLTLPSATDVTSVVAGTSRRLTVKRIAGINPVSITTVNSQNIDGGPGPLSITDNSAVVLKSDGAGWRTLSTASAGGSTPSVLFSMADYAKAAAYAGAAGDFSNGCAFRANSVVIAGGRWYHPTGMTANVTLKLWDLDAGGTLLASSAAVAPTPGAVNSASFTVPYAAGSSPHRLAITVYDGVNQILYAGGAVPFGASSAFVLGNKLFYDGNGYANGDSGNLTISGGYPGIDPVTT